MQHSNLIVCSSCKTPYNVLSHSRWGLGQFFGGGVSLKFRGRGGGDEKRQSPDFRSPEVGIFVPFTYASSLLSESLEQAKLNVDNIGVRDSCKVRLCDSKGRLV